MSTTARNTLPDITRLGRFMVTTATIKAAPFSVREAMGQCIITRAQYSFIYDRFEYEAMSPYFDECAQGQKIPLYQCIIRGNDAVTFEKVIP